MSRLLRTLAMIGIASLLAACGQAPTPRATPSATTPSDPKPSIADTRWLLETITGAPIAPGTTVTAHFAADGTLNGSDGCNRYLGSYTVTGGTLQVGDALASTQMACDAAVMDQARAYTDALLAARGFAVQDDRLELSDEDETVVLTFTREVQELAGTSWRVTGYNNGQQAVVGVIEGTAPTVSFGTDGSVSGSGGCNSIGGGFTTGAGTLEIGQMTSTLMACSEPAGVMEQEAQLVAALESAATYTIEGNVLQLRTADDALAATLAAQE